MPTEPVVVLILVWRYNKRHVALKILYVGVAYQGFAVQEDTDRTIEAAIFSALLKSRLIESRSVYCREHPCTIYLTESARDVVRNTT